MSSEAALTLMALITLVVCIGALIVSVFYSVPYALRRVRAYPKPGARRTFAVLTAIGVIAPTVVVGCFLAVAVVVLSVDDLLVRSAVTRSVLLVGILILAAQVVFVPVGHRYVQEQAEAEAIQRRERREEAEEALVENIERERSRSEDAHEKRHREAREREREHHEIQKKHEEKGE